MKKKIIILTAGFGEGHNAAARGLKAALTCGAMPQPVEAETMDLFDLCYGRRGRLLKQSYLQVVAYAPRAWSWIYGVLDRSQRVQQLAVKPIGMARKLREIILRERPDALVSVYPLYGHLLEYLRRRYPGDPLMWTPLTTVVTDSLTINSIWLNPATDCYAVANPDTSAVLIRMGVAPQRIHAFGFPVARPFAELPVTRTAPVPGGPYRVLLMVNSHRRDCLDLVRPLAARPEISLTVTVGRRPKLQAMIEETAREAEGAGPGAPLRTRIYGWTDQLPQILLNSHVLIGKAGGASVQEAIAAQCPMIVNEVLPGQEEGNAQLLVANEAGLVATTPEGILEAVSQLFADDAALWRGMAVNLARMSRPQAAEEIGKFVLSHLGAPLPD